MGASFNLILNGALDAGISNKQSQIDAASQQAVVIEQVDNVIIDKNIVKYDNDLEMLNEKVALGNGNTGRFVPNNLNEQLAMKEVLTDPLTNAKDLSQYFSMNDDRWLNEDGWVKMSKIVNGIEIHFVYNTITGLFDDFKFK